MASPSRSTPQIFISHSHEDNDFALKLARDLRDELGDDKAVWIDKAGGLRAGDDWLREIIEQITTRYIFIVVLSSDAVIAEWVKFEFTLALNQQLRSTKTILPIRYTLNTFDVPLRLSGLQEIDFRPPRPYDDALTELLARCLEVQPTPTISRRAFIMITASTIAVIALPGVLSIGGFLQDRFLSTDAPQTSLSTLPLLYQADWSQGLAGWDSPGFTTGNLICTPNTAHKGWLLCDGTTISDPGYGSRSSMFAPFLPATANYAVEVEMQVIDVHSQTACNFGILVRWLLGPFGTQGGYVLGIGGFGALTTPFFEQVVEQNSTTKPERNASGEGYMPGTSWHRYRVEAKNNTIALYIDNQKIFVEKNGVFSEAGQVGLLCSGCRLNVRNFKVIGL